MNSEALDFRSIHKGFESGSPYQNIGKILCDLPSACITLFPVDQVKITVWQCEESKEPSAISTHSSNLLAISASLTIYWVKSPLTSPLKSSMLYISLNFLLFLRVDLRDIQNFSFQPSLVWWLLILLVKAIYCGVTMQEKWGVNLALHEHFIGKEPLVWGMRCGKESYRWEPIK